MRTSTPRPPSRRPILLAAAFVALQGGCGGADPGDDWVRQLDVRVSEAMPTVVEVSWTSAEPTTGWVQWGEPDPPGHRWPLEWSTARDSEPTAEHSVLMLGLLDSTSYELEVWNEREGRARVSERVVIETGALPEFTAPSVTVEADAERAGGFTLVPVLGPPEQEHIAIFDGDGQRVWAYAPGELGTVPRARLSQDGRSLLYLRSVQRPDDAGAVVRVDLTGEVEETLWEIPGAFMDFVELEPGRVVVIALEPIELDDGERTLLRETLVELDDSGGSRTVVDLVDALGIDLGESSPENLFGPGVEVPLHLNGLSYDGEQDMLLVTSANRDAVYSVQRGSGELAWVLSKHEGDFASATEIEDLVFEPHSAELVEGGVLVFDRGITKDDCSTAVEFELDLTAMEALRAAEFAPDDCVHTGIMGNAQRLWNGDTTVVVAMAGRIDEFDPDGEPVQRMSLPMGHAFAYAERFEGFYR